MTVELFINNVKLDLDKEIVFPLNYAIADVKEPEKRKRNASKTIKLPGTVVNNRFFSSAWDLHISDVRGDSLGFEFDPTLRYPAKVNKGGTNIFRGSANLQKVVDTGGVYTYEVVLYSETVNLFQALGDLTVNELGWSAYDHTLSIANITGSWTAGVGSGYVYPLIDYGFNPNPLDYKTNELRPFVYVAEVVEKCLEVAGWTLDSDFFDSALIQKLIFGYGGGEKINLTALEVAERRVTYTGDGTTTEQFPRSSTAGGNQFVYFEYTRFWPIADGWITLTQVNDTLAQLDTASGELVVANAGDYSFNITGTFPVDYSFIVGLGFAGTVNLEFTLEIYRNFAVVAEQTITVVDTITAGTPSGSDTLNFNLTKELFCNSGDVLSASIRLNTANTVTNPIGYNSILTVDIDLDNTLNMDFQAQNLGIVDGDTVELSRYIPNMKASDFMKDVTTMFNLYMSDPDEDGNVKIEPIDDYYYGTDDTDDWREKLDRSRPIEIMPASNIEGKVYEFHWAEDQDYYKQLYTDVYGNNYGDYDYNVPSTFKKGVKKYHLKIAQSVPVQIEGTDIIIPRIVKLDTQTNTTIPYKGKPRMFFFNGSVASDNWILRESDTLTGFIQSAYGQAHHLDDIAAPTFDLNFGVPAWLYYTATAYTNDNLFNRHHAQFIRELTSRDSKIVNAYFKLDESDLYPDFLRRLVNIDGVIYRKNIVKDFRANNESTTKVELVKILTGNSRKTFNVYTDTGDLWDVDTVDGADESPSGQPVDDDFTVKSWYGGYLVDTTTKSITATLDADTLPRGKTFEIKKLSSPNYIDLTPKGGGAAGSTIEGKTSIRIRTKDTALKIRFDGQNFWII